MLGEIIRGREIARLEKSRLEDVQGCRGYSRPEVEVYLSVYLPVKLLRRSRFPTQSSFSPIRPPLIPHTLIVPRKVLTSLDTIV